MTGKRQLASSQTFLEFTEIREGVVVLKNGDLRAVLMASGINFALKSEEEQNAIIYAYQDFLNSLDFPVEIIVQSRRVEIDEYIDRLRKREEEEVNDLLKMQTKEYVSFISSLVSHINIMTKFFFVVVPLGAGGVKPPVTSLLKETFNLSKEKTKVLTHETFLELHGQLMQRIEYIASGLIRIGVNARMLSTEEVLELYWRLYNPDEGSLPPVEGAIEGAMSAPSPGV